MRDLMRLAMDRMLDLKAEFCDVRSESTRDMRLMVVDGSVRSLEQDASEGVCLRARVGGAWGCASLVSAEKKKMLEAAETAVRSARLGNATGVRIAEGRTEKGDHRPKLKLHPAEVPIEEKLELVLDLDRAQRVNAKIVNSNSVYLEAIKRSTVMNSFGTDVSWEEVRERVMVQPVASDGGRTELFYDISDGTGGYEVVKAVDANAMGKEAAKEAIKMLKAEKCPSGKHVCITDPQISGLLAHEVMGHASEADEIVKKRSFLTDVVGKKVASEQITMVDDGTVPGAHGTIQFDDEGTRAQRTMIIEGGVYEGYMHSLETAAEMGVQPTGNGRAESTSRRVFVRMRNTFFEKGDWKLEEIIEGVKFGVLTDKAISGMEDPVGGGFEAKVLRGFLIENGEVTKMLRTFSVTGKALEILKTTDAVGNKLELDGGTCGKGIEDFVPVSSGGPHCRSVAVLGGS
ncbi:MAG TPA: TldD/PmbA family protein [Methanomassiliicoccales archaeon]|nr:TldD/PmbA family protein [Methanomassiliicoccales archaeon]